MRHRKNTGIKMKETILKCYFDGKVPALDLRSALESIKAKQTLPAYSNFELDLEIGYTVAIKDLVRICNDVLNGLLDEADIRIIAFLMMSAAFRSVDMALEESATMSGSGTFSHTWGRKVARRNPC